MSETEYYFRIRDKKGEYNEPDIFITNDSPPNLQIGQTVSLCREDCLMKKLKGNYKVKDIVTDVMMRENNGRLEASVQDKGVMFILEEK